MYSEEILADGRIRLGTFDPENYWQFRTFDSWQEIEDCKKFIPPEDINDG